MPWPGVAHREELGWPKLGTVSCASVSTWTRETGSVTGLPGPTRGSPGPDTPQRRDVCDPRSRRSGRGGARPRPARPETIETPCGLVTSWIRWRSIVQQGRAHRRRGARPCESQIFCARRTFPCVNPLSAGASSRSVLAGGPWLLRVFTAAATPSVGSRGAPGLRLASRIPRRQYRTMDNSSGVGVPGQDSGPCLAPWNRARPSLAQLVQVTGLARPTAHRIAVGPGTAPAAGPGNAQGRFILGPRIAEAGHRRG